MSGEVGALGYKLTVEEVSREMLAIQEHVLSSGLDIDRLMRGVAEGTLRIIPGADGVHIELRDANERVCRAAGGIAARHLGTRRRISGSLFEQCVISRQAHLCTDVENDPSVNLTACREGGIKAIILAPIMLQGAVSGVFKAFSKQPGALGEADLLIAQLLAGVISSGLTRLARDEAYRARDLMSQRFQATFDQAAVGIAHVAMNGDFLLVNERFCTIAGHDRETLLHQGFQQITHPADLDVDVENSRRLVAGEIPYYAMEKRYIRADMALVWVNLTVSLVRQQDGTPDFFVAVVEDISDRKSALHRAYHDVLTGLPNRLWLADNFNREILNGSALPTVLAYIDLDGFKAVNDQLGHAEGDRCLIATAAWLQFFLRDGDTVCRMAGDEFVILMPRTDRAEAVRLIHDLRSGIEKLSRQQRWGIGVSVGAVVIDPADTTELDVILSAADRMMYESKRGSCGSPVIHDLGTILAN